MGEGKVAAASALRPLLPRFGHPERGSLSLLPERAMASHPSVFYCSAGPPHRVGLFVPAEVEPEFRLYGTLNASVFVHCGCRGLNMYVILARSHVFSSFSSTKTRLLVA